MADITLIDDDLTEALVLGGLLDHIAGGHRLTHVTRVEDFDPNQPGAPADLVLLDRRVPPHNGFETSLPVLAASGYDGPVVLVSATGVTLPEKHFGLRLLAAVSKADLLTPEAVEALLQRSLDPDRRHRT